MSIWNDLFEIYQSVQSEDSIVPVQKESAIPSKTNLPTSDSNEPSQPTVYVFAYIDDGKGNITRNIAVEDRITILELKNQELEHRYNLLLDELEKSDSFDQTED